MKGKMLLLIVGACVQVFVLSEVWAQNALLSEWLMDNAKRAVREHRFDEAEEHYIAALKEAPDRTRASQTALSLWRNSMSLRGSPKRRSASSSAPLLYKKGT